MSPATFSIITLVLLLGLFLCSSLRAARRRLFPRDMASLESTQLGLILFQPLARLFWSTSWSAATQFCLMFTSSILRFLFAIAAVVWLYLLDIPPFEQTQSPDAHTWGVSILTLVALLIVGFLCGEYLPRVLGTRFSKPAYRFCAPLASVYLLLTLPLALPLYSLLRYVRKTDHLDRDDDPTAEVGREILELLQELKITSRFDAHDKKLIASVVNFRHQLAKEVMVPRVDVFSLPGTISIREATRLLDPEGYSRIPVFGTSIDEIRGVLMHKDLLRKYMEAEASGNKSILDAPIETIVKDVIFTPETKKLSLLLQEFRNKKVHLAIVVDEYGGTEGIVTIEDILEQIVGEIADEYDDEESMYTANPEGGWVVDARMSILDIEEQLNVTFPEGDYDTLAGFIFQCAGSIPPKGFIIHRDNLDLEVLSSNDRMVEKVWLKPTSQIENFEESDQ